MTGHGLHKLRVSQGDTTGSRREVTWDIVIPWKFSTKPSGPTLWADIELSTFVWTSPKKAAKASPCCSNLSATASSVIPPDMRPVFCTATGSLSYVSSSSKNRHVQSLHAHGRMLTLTRSSAWKEFHNSDWLFLESYPSYSIALKTTQPADSRPVLSC